MMGWERIILTALCMKEKRRELIILVSVPKFCVRNFVLRAGFCFGIDDFIDNLIGFIEDLNRPSIVGEGQG